MKVIDDFNLSGTPRGSALIYFCPGCKSCHAVNLTKNGPFRDNQGGVPVWTWNGSYEKPTIRPSVLVAPASPRICHAFITDGQIQFLADSFHELAGKTVPMEPPFWIEEAAP